MQQLKAEKFAESVVEDAALEWFGELPYALRPRHRAGRAKAGFAACGEENCTVISVKSFETKW